MPRSNVTCDVMQPRPEPAGEHYGFRCRVAGLYEGQPYCVDVWCEHDGRDVEMEPVWGAAEEAIANFDLLDVLCEQPEFTAAMSADYTRWEAGQ